MPVSTDPVACLIMAAIAWAALGVVLLVGHVRRKRRELDELLRRLHEDDE